MPAPAWALPEGMPSLFDPSAAAPVYIFFSGRVALAAVVGLELVGASLYSRDARTSKATRALLMLAGVGWAAFNVGLHLALHMCWTFDVVVALVFARYCTIIANRFSQWFDAFMP